MSYARGAPALAWAGVDPRRRSMSMAIAGTPLPIRFIPALALAAAVAACQPGAPTTQQPVAAAGPVPAGIFDGLEPGERINFQCNEISLGAAPARGRHAVRPSYSGQRLERPPPQAATRTRH